MNKTRKQIVNELHRSARRTYPRRHVKLLGINDLLQADLVEMRPFARINKGMHYILTAINCTTKYGYAYPLKNKTGASVAKALEKVLKHNRFRYLQTDDGKEWYNAKVRELLIKYGTRLYSSFTEKKASICERFNRTLKARMYKYFTLRNSDKWVDMLPVIVKEYNSSKHRTIGMRPDKVNSSNIGLVMRNIDKNRKSFIPKRYHHLMIRPRERGILKIGDRVRISKHKSVFDKSYKANWSNEIFTITDVRPTKPVTYLLKDHNNVPIKGGFYTEELQKTRYGDVYLIDKILARRGNRVKVLWQGFDRHQASWIEKGSII